MLEEIEAGPPPGWDHAAAWAERMRAWAARCERIVVLSASQVERVERLLGIEAERCVRIPNGFDPHRFTRRGIDRAAHWARHLVRSPRGWAPGQEPGSIRYREKDLAAFEPGHPVLLYVGRFTAVKRVGLLIRAHPPAQEGFRRPA